MRIMWIDTETTGLEVTDSSVFMIGAIVTENGVVLCEKTFFLNPLSETIKYHESAGAVHGYSEEDIKSFPAEKTAVVDIAKFFERARELWRPDGSKSEKMVIAGYNVTFDIKHLQTLFERNGLKLEDYFSGVIADVYLQVQKAMGNALPVLKNKKLVTVADYLGVDLTNAHDAMADIRATREVAKSLNNQGVSLL